MEPKFGKVYILEREICANGMEMVKPKLLESISFSNIDYKWYDSEGTLSPLYKKYEGRPFSIQYNIKQQDKDGRDVEFQAKLDLTYKLGELPPQDFESVPTITAELTERWKKCQLLTGDVKNDERYRIVRDVQAASFVAAICPGWKISQMKVILVSTDPYFILDDYIDKGAAQKDMPFKLSQPYYAVLDDILQGNPYSSKLKKLPDSYRKVIVGMEEFRDVINEKTQSKKYLLEAYTEFHNACHLENCQEWKQKQGDKTSLMYISMVQEVRLITIGARLAVEMILYDQDIQLDEKFRETLLFRSLLRVYGKIMAQVNDIVSLKKEMAADETSNVVYNFHTRDGLPLEEALQKVVDDINLLTKILIETGELLISLYGEYEETQKVVDIIKYILDGNIQWSGICNRYHPNMITDCIVGLE